METNSGFVLQVTVVDVASPQTPFTFADVTDLQTPWRRDHQPSAWKRSSTSTLSTMSESSSLHRQIAHPFRQDFIG